MHKWECCMVYLLLIITFGWVLVQIQARLWKSPEGRELLEAEESSGFQHIGWVSMSWATNRIWFRMWSYQSFVDFSLLPLFVLESLIRLWTSLSCFSTIEIHQLLLHRYLLKVHPQVDLPPKYLEQNNFSHSFFCGSQCRLAKTWAEDKYLWSAHPFCLRCLELVSSSYERVFALSVCCIPLLV